MTEPVLRMIYGHSDAVEAEYSARAEDDYTIAEAADDEVYAVRGYPTWAAMMRVVKGEYAEVPRERVGIYERKR